MDQCSATLLGSPCQEPSHHFQNDIGCACRTACEVRVAEPRIDSIDDHKWVCFGCLLCHLSYREELQKLGDLVAAGDETLSRVEAGRRCEEYGKGTAYRSVITAVSLLLSVASELGVFRSGKLV